MAPATPIVFIDTPRGRFAALTDGPPAGPVVLCVHGFPDIPATFVPLMSALAAAGYRAVAPWLRGYAPSPLTGDFGAEALGADLLALCEVLAARRVVGHDWGALAVYAALAQAPAALHAAVTLAVPQFQSILRNAIGGPRQLAQQLVRSRYILLFQLPGSEHWLHHRDLAYVDTLWRRWSPSLPPPEAHLGAVKRTLAASGVAPLRHYRAMLPSLLRAPHRPLPTTTPLLYIAGTTDGCIGVDMSAGQASLVSGRYQERIYEGAGHFVHLERPREVAADILEWIQ